MSKTARVAICVIPLVLAALICTAAFPDALKRDLAPFIRNVASGLFLTAGVVRMAAWRLTRDWVAPGRRSRCSRSVPRCRPHPYCG